MLTEPCVTSALGLWLIRHKGAEISHTTLALCSFSEYGLFTERRGDESPRSPGCVLSADIVLRREPHEAP